MAEPTQELIEKSVKNYLFVYVLLNFRDPPTICLADYFKKRRFMFRDDALFD